MSKDLNKERASIWYTIIWLELSFCMKIYSDFLKSHLIEKPTLDERVKYDQTTEVKFEETRSEKNIKEKC